MIDREINFRDLAFDIMLHWRSMILWILIGAIAFGISGYKKNKDPDPKDIMTQTELLTVKQVLLNEDFSQKWQSYIKNSVLMDLDTSKVYQADLVYSVNAAEIPLDPSSIYLDLLATNTMYQLVSEKVDNISASDAQEAIHVTNAGSPTQKQDVFSFRITVTAKTKKICRAISKAVQLYINNIHQQIINIYGTHDMILLQDNITDIYSTSLLQEQIDIRNKVVYLDSEAAKLIESFSEAQMQYYLSHTSKDSFSQNTLQTSQQAASTSIGAIARSVVWGMVSTSIIYIFIIFFLYITNNKLRYTDDHTALYHIPVLGHIPMIRASKTFFSRVDYWLYCHRDKERYAVSAEQAVRLAVAAIYLSIQKKGFDQIYSVTCGPLTGSAKKLADQLQDILNTNDIELHTTDNILYDANSMKQLSHIQGAILIEKTGSVQYGEIQRVLSILRQQEIEILGLIVTE